MFNVKTSGTRGKATISAFFKAHSAKPLYELKKELWNFLTKHGVYLQSSVKASTKEDLTALGFVQFVDPNAESLKVCYFLVDLGSAADKMVEACAFHNVK